MELVHKLIEEDKFKQDSHIEAVEEDTVDLDKVEQDTVVRLDMPDQDTAVKLDRLDSDTVIKVDTAVMQHMRKLEEQAEHTQAEQQVIALELAVVLELVVELVELKLGLFELPQV